MASGLGLECQVCGFVGLDDGSDGFFYCQRCGAQAEGIRDTAVDNDDMILTKDNVAGLVQRRVPAVKNEPLTQSQPASQFWEDLWTQVDDVKVGDGVGPTEPSDFGRGPRTLEYHDYYSELRIRYVMGVQIMIQLQMKALIETFKVHPIIVDLVQPIWMRFVASTKVFTDGWADQAIAESESQVQGETEIVGPRPRHKNEPHNLLGKRNVMIWYQSVSKTIPLCYSLVFSFLACHLAREAVLPTDIINWALEGKLPYFAAFVDIDKQMGPPTNACPLKSSLMFRPIQSISTQKLESLAGIIAHSIGLLLPPVNFYAIASRYLNQLSLPVETILPHACKIYEWSMPAELWISANDSRLPTRAYVLSLLIVSIRILYNIHGFGKWEMSLSGTLKNKDGNISKGTDIDVDEEKVDENNVAEMSDTSSSESDNDDSAADPCDKKVAPNLDATDILLVLHSKYSELIHTSDYCKDLESYLKYCKDVVFAGTELSFEDHEEAQIIEDLWNFYQKKEDYKPPECSPSSSSQLMRSPTCAQTGTKETKKPKNDNAKITLGPKESHKERAIRQMISNMEENHFTYIPPRTKVKRHDYLHYTRKKVNGAYAHAAHADYYILLRSCARVAQLDVRIMHAAVQNFERRLAWLEKNIQHCLPRMVYAEPCQFCNADDEPTHSVPDDEYVDFSKLNL
uniref:TATA box-binding protein-associated factor RNA polymerase I subunit B-like n=1 Tax=Erigeron canadensis TaxID=72917 RepID=UPI001CB949FD|nr:TATA box-binding protein-associated factor RNA polymerase I subunit B-like [Erigeron canadensis]XP_043610471.1 TATA box-binding protein-associated factor RNA polymerase I subunit B-like [Erigeron canadensis]